MGKEYTMQEALKLAIKAEKDSMDFYRQASAMTTDERSKKVFNLLAAEEVGHLKAFFTHYQGGDLGDLSSYIATAPDRQAAVHKALQKAVAADTQEQKALEIALKEEQACIDLYKVLARDVVDPLVRRVFETVIQESQGHYEMIEDEYMRVMGMVDKSDQDTYVRE